MPPSLFLAARHDTSVVAVSILIATLASYVALDLAKRVRTSDRTAARLWWLGGSIALGSGIWAMHFVGMLALSLPIAIGYTKTLTVLSWVAAVGVSSAALAISSRDTLGAPRLVGGSLLMGGGICAMHYLGMAAIDLAPGIRWDFRWVAASAVIAVVASGAALSIFFWLRTADRRRRLLHQALAAGVMGLAISGMHYAGMAAAAFPADAICFSADSFVGSQLGVLIAIASVGLLGVTLWTSVVDARMQSNTARMAASLQVANAQLQDANAELRDRAFLDPLTRLPNRLLFEDRLDQAIGRLVRAGEREGPRSRAKLAVLFIDLDGFKAVNDTLGHAAGDDVLCQAAERLRATARATDTVARVGGDEFLLLMEGVDSAADCGELAMRLIQTLSAPVQLAERQVSISGSIGIVLYPDQDKPEKLIASADAAMYAAKRAGRGTYAMFETDMGRQSFDNLGIQQDLRAALALGQFQLHYQPKIDAARGVIGGVEALLRWTHPTRGTVPPNVFIPVAERFGLIGAIGQWVVDETCRQIAAWAREGVRMRVAINVSVHQLREHDLVERIRAALDRHRVEPSQLLCEITESVAMEDIKATHRTFDGLAKIGVYLSIDDFGTGYSSLAYLRQLPARQLKIDRSFVADLEESIDARAVVDAVVRLAHALGLKVVAEGVETAGQHEILLGLGCDELQGYYFARPMPAAAMLDWIRGRKPTGAADFSPSILLAEAA